MTVPEKPCPMKVKIENGRLIYCEQGPEGHPGTHHGDRSRSEYLALLRRWREHRRARRAAI